MTAPARSIPLEALTTLTARVLSAYYGLLAEGQPTEWIGGREIARWIECHLPGAEVPGESTVVKTLQAAGLAHRGRGQPSHASRAAPATPPFCPPEATPPRRSSA